MSQARISGEWYPVKRKTPWLIYFGVALVALLLPLIFGFALEVTPTFIPVAFLFALVLIASFFFHGRIFIFLSVFGVLFIPQYKVQDFLLVVTLVWAAWIALDRQSRGFQVSLWPRWAKLFALLILWAMASAALGYVIAENDPKAIYGEFRSFLYLLYAPLLLIFFRGKNSESITNAVLLIAGVVSVIVISQGAFGVAFLGTGRVGSLDSSGGSSIEASVTRVQISGIMIVFFALMVVVARYFQENTRGAYTYLALMVLYVLALYFNFGRAVWFWMVVSIVAISLLSGKRATYHFVFVLALVSVTYLIIKIVFNPISLEVLENRVLSVSAEGGYGTSYGWRQLENREAINSLLSTYGVGVGVGGEYRPFYIPLRVFPQHVLYIHQGYLYIALKLSLVGLALYLAALIMAVFAAFKGWRTSALRNPDLLAAMVTILAYMGLNMTQPIFMAYDGIMALGCVLAMLFRSRDNYPARVASSAT